MTVSVAALLTVLESPPYLLTRDDSKSSADRTAATIGSHQHCTVNIKGLTEWRFMSVSASNLQFIIVPVKLHTTSIQPIRSG